jgi:hypothetical protein
MVPPAAGGGPEIGRGAAAGAAIGAGAATGMGAGAGAAMAAGIGAAIAGTPWGGVAAVKGFAAAARGSSAPQPKQNL